MIFPSHCLCLNLEQSILATPNQLTLRFRALIYVLLSHSHELTSLSLTPQILVHSESFVQSHLATVLKIM